jgi:hypothetical protein
MCKKSLLLVLLALSCSKNPVADSDLNRIVVLAVLSPNFDRQTIILYEGINEIYTDGLPIGGLDNPLRRARVVVRSEGQEVMFTEVAPGEYQDVVQSLHVEPGKTYFLEASAPKGQVVEARTTVPNPIYFLQPEDSLEVADSTFVKFIWTESAGAAAYTFNWRLPCEHPNYSRVGYPVYSNSIVLLLRQWSFCEEDQPVYTFWVYALDSAFASYIDAIPNRGTNIENGAGVFGSMVSDSLNIIVVP